MTLKSVLLAFLCVLFLSSPAMAGVEETANDGKTASGLALPRFASLHANEVNLRTGPGTRYPIEWVFKHQGLPIEITAEYEIWRRIKDSEGSEGWVHKMALSGKRTAIITGMTRDLRKKESIEAPIIAHLEAGSMGQLLSCGKAWCKLKFDGIKGYLPKTDFWGAYPNEVFD